MKRRRMGCWWMCLSVGGGLEDRKFEYATFKILEPQLLVIILYILF